MIWGWVLSDEEGYDRLLAQGASPRRWREAVAASPACAQGESSARGQREGSVGGGTTSPLPTRVAGRPVRYSSNAGAFFRSLGR